MAVLARRSGMHDQQIKDDNPSKTSGILFARLQEVDSGNVWAGEEA